MNDNNQSQTSYSPEVRKTKAFPFVDSPDPHRRACGLASNEVSP